MWIENLSDVEPMGRKRFIEMVNNEIKRVEYTIDLYPEDIYEIEELKLYYKELKFVQEVFKNELLELGIPEANHHERI